MAKKKGDEKVNQTPQSDNEEQNFDEEPDFDDPEGFVDDIPDEGGQFSVTSLTGHMRHPRILQLFIHVVTIFNVIVSFSVC